MEFVQELPDRFKTPQGQDCAKEVKARSIACFVVAEIKDDTIYRGHFGAASPATIRFSTVLFQPTAAPRIFSGHISHELILDPDHMHSVMVDMVSLYSHEAGAVQKIQALTEKLDAAEVSSEDRFERKDSHAMRIRTCGALIKWCLAPHSDEADAAIDPIVTALTGGCVVSIFFPLRHHADPALFTTFMENVTTRACAGLKHSNAWFFARQHDYRSEVRHGRFQAYIEKLSTPVKPIWLLDGQTKYVMPFGEGATAKIIPLHSETVIEDIFMPALLWNRDHVLNTFNKQFGVEQRYSAIFSRSVKADGVWVITVRLGGDKVEHGGEVVLPPNRSKATIFIDHND